MEWIFGVADLVVKTNTYSMYNQLPKLGVAYADSISTQVCRYFSPVFKSASCSYPRNESALQALISNRRPQTKAVLFSLKCILECAIDDKQRRILRYLQTMDPPTFQFARYWDWIKPWVESEVEANTRNQHIPAYAAELELSINVLSLIEQVNNLEKQDTENNAEDGGQPRQYGPQQNGDIIQYPLDDGGPKPYIMWEIQQYDTIDRKDDHEAKCGVYIHRVKCGTSVSYPTGDNNLALLDVFRSYN